MIKNLYTRSLPLLVCFILSYTVATNNTYEHASTGVTLIAYTKKPLLAFDLHGVIFAINYPEVIKKTVSVFAQWNGLLLILNPDFWLDLVLLAFNIRQLEFLLQRYPVLSNGFENLSNIIQGHELIPEMPAIIHALKKDGYSIYLFSNIAEKNFNKLLQQFPALFADFDGFVVAQPSDGWIQKPNKKAYEKFLATTKTNPDEIILIDDNKQNIKAAKSLGFKTILYTSPEQMLSKLQMLGVPKPSVAIKSLSK